MDTVLYLIQKIAPKSKWLRLIVVLLGVAGMCKRLMGMVVKWVAKVVGLVRRVGKVLGFRRIWVSRNFEISTPPPA